MFHVPEIYRIHKGPMGSNESYGNNGCFMFPPKVRQGLAHHPAWHPIHGALMVIASDGGGWEHVSVHSFSGLSQELYTPYWEEMCFIKDLFWDIGDVVIQYHPSKENYVNVHPNTLHLWRQANGWDNLLMPPIQFV